MLQLDVRASDSTPDTHHFRLERLKCLKIPKEGEMWANINCDFVRRTDIQELRTELLQFEAQGMPTQMDAQSLVNRAVACVSDALYETFDKYGLVKKRSFGQNAGNNLSPNARHAAPPKLP